MVQKEGAVVSPNTHLPILSFWWNLNSNNEVLFVSPVSQPYFEAGDFKVSGSLPSVWGSFGLISASGWPSRNELTFLVAHLGYWAGLAASWAVEGTLFYCSLSCKAHSESSGHVGLPGDGLHSTSTLSWTHYLPQKWWPTSQEI